MKIAETGAGILRPVSERHFSFADGTDNADFIFLSVSSVSFADEKY